MKILKFILFALIGIMFTFLVSNFFFDKAFNVQSSVKIKTSPYVVFDQVENFENWPNWDPWMAADSTVVISLDNNNVNKEGAVRKWNSDHSGDGYLTQLSNEYIKQLDYDIHIDNSPPFYTTFYFESDTTTGVVVSWRHHGELPFLSRVFGPFMKKMIKNDQINGLKNLKIYCESLPSKTSEISLKTFYKKKELSIEDSCSVTDFEQTLSENYRSIFVMLAENGIMPTSSPFVQYIRFPDQPGEDAIVVYKAGVFIETPIEANTITNNAKYYETSETTSLQAIHHGDHRTINDTHQKIKEYCLRNNFKILNLPYEVYLSDPNLTPNASDWKTRVIYQIE